MAAPTTKTTRVHAINTLKISVPPPRVRTAFLDQASRYTDHYMARECDEPSTISKDKDGNVKEYPHKAVRAKKELQMGPPTNATLSCVCSLMLEYLMRFSANHAVNNGLKRVKLEHLYDSDVSTMPFYPLVARLELVSEQQAKAHARALAAAVAKATVPEKKPKQSQTQHDATPAPATPQPDAAHDAQPATPATESEEDAADKRHEFATYIARAFRDMCESFAEYKELMLSQELKHHLSDILVFFIKSMAASCLPIIEASDTSTFKPNTIMKAVKSIMLGYNRPDEYEHMRNYVGMHMKLYYESEQANPKKTKGESAAQSSEAAEPAQPAETSATA